MPNTVKQAWADGKTTVNGWLAIPTGFSAEVMAQAGWDSLTVDLQHGVQDYQTMVACFQGMQGHPVLPMVRVPWNEPGIIGKVLDAGAYGVICPMVNTRAEAEAFVASCKYPPQGRRSNGPIRAGIYGVTTSYQETANENVLAIAMTETQEALDNLDAILDTPGLDAVYVGPSDLGFSMGLKPVMDREEPQILAAYETILAGARKRSLVAGLHCLTAAYAQHAIAMGFRMVTVGSDAVFINQGARATVGGLRDHAQKAAA
jgi:4-hydroxy-2-oxoheptanedioate aldolase